MRLTILPNAATSCGTDFACSPSACAAEASASATVGCAAAPRPALPEPEAQNGGIATLRARSVDIARCSIFMPLMPSISE